MLNLLAYPDAERWLNDALKRLSSEIYGKIKPAVIWTNALDREGQLRVPIDPYELSRKINQDPFIILHNHDPGNPKGQVLESAVFNNGSGVIFVAAIMGFYAGGNTIEFGSLDLNLNSICQAPGELPDLPEDASIELAFDPRDVSTHWIKHISKDAPLKIRINESSYNDAQTTQELISIGIGYLAIVWNPFVTAVASEAGKKAYTALHNWLLKLFNELAERKNPIINLVSHQNGCQVFFILRGKDVKQHYAAHQMLSSAGVQAAELIRKLKKQDKVPTQLTYEWDKEAQLWYPSYAVLSDKSIIVDRGTLIAIEQLPKGLSLGFSKGNSQT
ncbi:hypothetical protein [Lelliottia wanjuensis]|uniref:hypothetical protein n=1 Tax=Lelliottia wanjuensis TaxID=3050585 RepID=UPI002550BF39|nr:hypothetical protein [Lelliottia sp. V104_15]MDK9603252.1 hypothetical protein [Lelliottia sp. V104_15]